MIYLLSRFIRSAIILGFIWLGGLVWFSLQIPEESKRPIPKSDAIVVLTGGSGRIQEGLKLLEENASPLLFISGVEGNLSAQRLILANDESFFNNSENYRRFKSIYLGRKAQNTIGNIAEINDWVADRHIQSITLITANYHMPRALLEFKHDMQKDILLLPHPVFPKDFNNRFWWKNDTSRNLVLSEYHKYFAAMARHLLISTVEKTNSA